MSQSNSLVPTAAALAACALAVFLSFPTPDSTFIGPVIVVAPPWSEDAQRIVERAGGEIIGPARAPFSVIAANVPSAAYLDAGAWAVLSASAFAILCGPIAPEPLS